LEIKIDGIFLGFFGEIPNGHFSKFSNLFIKMDQNEAKNYNININFK
jgi:hypothetical protein